MILSGDRLAGFVFGMPRKEQDSQLAIWQRTIAAHPELKGFHEPAIITEILRQQS